MARFPSMFRALPPELFCSTDGKRKLGARALRSSTMESCFTSFSGNFSCDATLNYSGECRLIMGI
jgi:hypothetical protein